MATAIPKFPELLSTRCDDGVIVPERSPSSMMNRAGRSLTLPPGLSSSSLAITVCPASGNSRLNRTNGVRPTQLTMESWTTGAAFRQGS